MTSHPLVEHIEDVDQLADRLLAVYRAQRAEALPDANTIRSCLLGEQSVPAGFQDWLQTRWNSDEPGLPYWSKDIPQNLANVVYGQVSPALWGAARHQLMWLLLPLMPVRSLTTVLSFSPKDASRRLDTESWAQHRLAAYRQWGELLSEGKEGWEWARMAIEAAGVDPCAIREMFVQADADPRQRWEGSPLDEMLGRLSHLQVLAFAAGLGHRYHRDEPEWWRASLQSLTERVRYDYSQGVVGADALQQLAAPFLGRLVDDRQGLGRLIAGSPPEVVATLWNHLGLREWMLADALRYRLLADNLDPRHLGWLYVPEELAERFPGVWLEYARTLFQRSSRLPGTLLGTPDALAWYREALAQTEDREQINKLLAALQPALGDREIADLMLRYLGSDRDPDYQLFRQLSDFDVLESLLSAENSGIRERAADRLLDVSCVKPRDDEGAYAQHAERWPRLLGLCERFPDLFAQNTISDYNLSLGDLLSRWDLLWDKATQKDSHTHLADELLDVIKDPGTRRQAFREQALDLAERWYGAKPEVFSDVVEEFYEDSVPRLLPELASRDGKLMQLVPAFALRYLTQSSWFDGPPAPLDPAPLRRALRRYPETLEALDERALGKLLPLLDDASFQACGPILVAKLDKAKGKPLQAVVVSLIAGRSAEALHASGLVDGKAKALRLLLHRGLALNEDPKTLPLVRERLDDKANDDLIRGMLLDRLEAADEDVSELDAWYGKSIDELETLSAGIKVPAAVSKLWNADLAEMLAPLGEPLGQRLLTIMHKAVSNQLPRQARQLLELLPAATRGDLAEQACAMWVAENGSDKLAWLMALLPQYGDERAVNALVKAVKAWKSNRKQKANAAIHWMSEVPGIYGLAQVKILWESRQFSDSIIRNAGQALRQAAAARDLSLEDLLDEMAPDLGLTPEGLVLDMGPYAYRVQVQPDLSLRVFNPAGKATKSFPKAKAQEHPDKRSLAENRFKALRKNLKPLLKQQSGQLKRAMQCGKSWSTARWHKLYMEHPLLSILAQGMVWTGVDAAGQARLHFRPTESATLIDLEDNERTLDGIASLHITHPVELEDEAQAGWRQHFEDYEITSPIGQWETPAVMPVEEEMTQNKIDRHKGHVINRGTLAGAMDRWGYVKGEAQDGGRFYEHYLTLDNGRYRVQFNHSDISAWFEPDEMVTIENFEVYRKDTGRKSGAATLDRLPLALVATLLGQSAELAEKSEGFSNE